VTIFKSLYVKTLYRMNFIDTCVSCQTDMIQLFRRIFIAIVAVAAISILSSFLRHSVSHFSGKAQYCYLRQHLGRTTTYS